MGRIRTNKFISVGNLKVKPTISPNRRDKNTPIFFGKTLLVSTRSLKILLLPFNKKKLKIHFINDIFQKILFTSWARACVIWFRLTRRVPFVWRVFCLCSRSCNKTAKFRNTNKINVFKVTNLKMYEHETSTHTRHFWPKCLENKFFLFCEKSELGKI
jgi:hypothetical protein